MSSELNYLTKHLWLWCMERHLPSSTTPPRNPEHNSRHGIPCHGRQVRLDVEPKNLPEDSIRMGPPGSGPACIQTNITTDKLCQLETRPRGNSAGCIHTRLVPMEEVLCKSSLEPNRQSASTSTTPEITSGAGSTSMEITGVVSHTTAVAPEQGGLGGLQPTHFF